MMSDSTPETRVIGGLLTLVLAAFTLASTGCEVPLTDSGQYLKCSDGECRANYQCRLVEGMPACVPDSEASQYPEPGQDAGDMDAADAPSDTVSDADDAESDDADANTDADAEDAPDTQAPCQLEDTEIIFQVGDLGANEEGIVLAPSKVEVSIGNQPDWVSVNPDTVTLSVTDVPAYDVQFIDSQPPQFEPLSDAFTSTLTASRIGTYGVNATIERDDECKKSRTVGFAVLPFDTENPPEGQLRRCFYMEVWWQSSEQPAAESYLRFEDAVPASLQAELTSTQEIGPDIYSIYESTELVESEMRIGMDPRLIDSPRTVHFRFYSRTNPSAPITGTGVVDPEQTSEFYGFGGVRFGDSVEECYSPSPSVNTEHF